jgi:hypothetical protein
MDTCLLEVTCIDFGLWVCLPVTEIGCLFNEDSSLVKCYAASIGSYRRFRRVMCPHFQGQSIQLDPAGEVIAFVQNTCTSLPADTESHRGRLESSSTPM